MAREEIFQIQVLENNSKILVFGVCMNTPNTLHISLSDGDRSWKSEVNQNTVVSAVVENGKSKVEEFKSYLHGETEVGFVLRPVSREMDKLIIKINGFVISNIELFREESSTVVTKILKVAVESFRAKEGLLSTIEELRTTLSLIEEEVEKKASNLRNRLDEQALQFLQVLNEKKLQLSKLRQDNMALKSLLEKRQNQALSPMKLSKGEVELRGFSPCKLADEAVEAAGEVVKKSSQSGKKEYNGSSSITSDSNESADDVLGKFIQT